MPDIQRGLCRYSAGNGASSGNGSLHLFWRIVRCHMAGPSLTPDLGISPMRGVCVGLGVSHWSFLPICDFGCDASASRALDVSMILRAVICGPLLVDLSTPCGRQRADRTRANFRTRFRILRSRTIHLAGAEILHRRNSNPPSYAILMHIPRNQHASAGYRRAHHKRLIESRRSSLALCRGNSENTGAACGLCGFRL